MINKFKNFITENYSEEFQKRDIVVGDKIELDPFVDGEYWDDFNFSKNTTYKIEIVSINGDDVECELPHGHKTYVDSYYNPNNLVYEPMIIKIISQEIQNDGEIYIIWEKRDGDSFDEILNSDNSLAMIIKRKLKFERLIEE
jgi:hypothetical protein